MEKVRIRKIIEDIIITQFLNSEIDIVHEEDVTFKELGMGNSGCRNAGVPYVCIQESHLL